MKNTVIHKAGPEKQIQQNSSIIEIVSRIEYLLRAYNNK